VQLAFFVGAISNLVGANSLTSVGAISFRARSIGWKTDVRFSFEGHAA
jgi:hypothetical protein